MTADEFRSLALSLPEASESAHMNHPDFRVRGKIFATIGPNEDWAMVKLTPDLQASFVSFEPHVFQPFNGAWGRRGCTKVLLDPAQELTVRQALVAAWRSTAPKKLAQQHDVE
jgi:hypothetical protein